MIYEKVCDHCGHRERAYMHHINKQLVQALRQLVDFYESKQQPANLQEDLDLTKNQYNNFQKLKYFKVIANAHPGWVPTKTGIDFIYGMAEIPDRIITSNNEIIPLTDEVYKKISKPIKFVSVWEIDSTQWKHRSEYQQENAPTIEPLF